MREQLTHTHTYTHTLPQVIQKSSHSEQGAKQVYAVEVSGLAPLIVTLMYMDYPSMPNVMPLLVNDLDLKVLGPDGCVWSFGVLADVKECVRMVYVGTSRGLCWATFLRQPAWGCMGLPFCIEASAGACIWA